MSESKLPPHDMDSDVEADDNGAPPPIIMAHSLWAAYQTQTPQGRTKWLTRGHKYWQKQPATDDGVLGGFAHISGPDLVQTSLFISRLFPHKGGVAVDLGGGIGRVVDGALAPLFTHTHVVEPDARYAAVAKKGRATRVYQIGMQDFDFQAAVEAVPAKGYDLVWIQWCIGHLPDDDVVALLRRAAAALTPRGYIVLKENNCPDTEGFYLDTLDMCLTRSDKYYRALFQLAGLQLAEVELQRGFPSALYPVRMYALRRHKDVEAGSE